MTEHDGLALVEEACRRSALVWLTVGGGRAHPAWHVWREGAASVVSGGAEQPLPDLDAVDPGPVLVTVRSKDKGGRLVSWVARATPVPSDSEDWAAAAAALHSARLNARDGEAQPRRWAQESRITRLEPTGEVVESPGALPDDSHAAPPPPTAATTRGPLPFVLGRRRARRR